MDTNKKIRIDITDELIAEAVNINNTLFMESLPNTVEPHAFSDEFEKNIGKMIKEQKKNERRNNNKKSSISFINFASKAAVAVICILALNVVTAKALKLNMWSVLTDRTGDFIQIHFNKNYEEEDGTSTPVSSGRLRIKTLEGFELVDYYSEDDATLEIFESRDSDDPTTVSYNESLLDEAQEIDLAQGEVSKSTVGAYEVTFVSNDNYVIAFFTDSHFYHIITIQGKQASIEFTEKIIKNLEEQ